MTQGGTSFIQLHTSLTVTLTLIVVLGFSASQNLVVAYTIETDSIPTKVPASKTVTICEAFAADFAQAAADYTKCFLLNARPLTLCTKCITEFLKVNKTYGELEQETDAAQRCDQWILNADKIMAIQHTKSFFEKLWIDSACPNCFSSYSWTGNMSYSIASHVTKFQDLLNSTTQCFLPFMITAAYLMEATNKNSSDHNSTSGPSEACTECRQVYDNLNDEYLDLDNKYHGDLCMDIVDSMNYTRRQWGREFKCSGNAREDGVTITVTALFFLLPAVFYIASYSHYHRIERQIVKPNRMRRRAGTVVGHQELLTPMHTPDFHSSEHLSVNSELSNGGSQVST